MQKLSPRIRLKVLRKRAGLSWLDLALELGCSASVVQRWEWLNPRYKCSPNTRLACALQRWSKAQGDEILPSDWHEDTLKGLNANE